MSKGFLDDEMIDFSCEACGKKIEKSIGWLRSNQRVTCSCGATTQIDNKQFRGELDKLDRELNKLFR